MSIGFTVPFLNLIRQSFVGAQQIGLLTAAFGTPFSIRCEHLPCQTELNLCGLYDLS